MQGKGSCYEHKTANIQDPSLPFSVPGMDSAREDVLQMVLKTLILILPKTRYEEALLISRRSIYAFHSEPEVVELILVFESQSIESQPYLRPTCTRRSSTDCEQDNRSKLTPELRQLMQIPARWLLHRRSEPWQASNPSPLIT